MEKIFKSDEEWRRQLTPEQYEVARGKGTERPFCGAFYDHKKPGVYSCVCCGLPLFSSDAKFESGTGWPSFFQPVAAENVSTHEDRSYGMRRVEILCAEGEDLPVSGGFESEFMIFPAQLPARLIIRNKSAIERRFRGDVMLARLDR